VNARRACGYPSPGGEPLYKSAALSVCSRRLPRTAAGNVLSSASVFSVTLYHAATIDQRRDGSSPGAACCQLIVCHAVKRLPSRVPGSYNAIMASARWRRIAARSFVFGYLKAWTSYVRPPSFKREFPRSCIIIGHHAILNKPTAPPLHRSNVPILSLP
jgi:hypothetical protein